MLIGITGGIGAGKSVVSRVLRMRGFGVYDCDYRASVIMNSPEVLSLLCGRFGDKTVNPDGTLCRPFLASVIFNSEPDRLWVNALVHERVRADLERWHTLSGRNLFVETAILAESGLAGRCAEVWLVDASGEVRLRRALDRALRKEKAEEGSAVPEPDRIEKLRADIRSRMSSQQREFKLLSAGETPIKKLDNTGDVPILPRISVLLREAGLE